jgi:pre-mRNA-splicing factor SYF2
MERTNAWKWSIEQNERWEKKVSEQKARSDGSFHSEFYCGRPVEAAGV